jgi:hypothetical protein
MLEFLLISNGNRTSATLLPFQGMQSKLCYYGSTRDHRSSQSDDYLKTGQSKLVIVNNLKF